MSDRLTGSIKEDFIGINERLEYLEKEMKIREYPMDFDLTTAMVKKEDYDDLKQQLQAANKQLSVAKEALEFYAKDIKEDENWYEIAYDEGKKAKQALTKIGEIENE